MTDREDKPSKLDVLLKCLPDAPFKTHLKAEIDALTEKVRELQAWKDKVMNADVVMYISVSPDGIVKNQPSYPLIHKPKE